VDATKAKTDAAWQQFRGELETLAAAVPGELRLEASWVDKRQKAAARFDAMVEGSGLSTDLSPALDAMRQRYLTMLHDRHASIFGSLRKGELTGDALTKAERDWTYEQASALHTLEPTVERPAHVERVVELFTGEFAALAAARQHSKAITDAETVYKRAQEDFASTVRTWATQAFVENRVQSIGVIEEWGVWPQMVERLRA